MITLTVKTETRFDKKETLVNVLPPLQTDNPQRKETQGQTLPSKRSN